MSTDSPYNFTSTAIKENPEGKYEFYEMGLLIPHEMLRREFTLALKALDSMDAVAHPWKAECVKVWFHEYLIPGKFIMNQ